MDQGISASIVRDSLGAVQEWDNMVDECGGAFYLQAL